MLDVDLHRWTPVRVWEMRYHQFTRSSIPRPWNPIRATRQGPYDQLDCSLFAVENRAMGLQKVSLTRGTVQLAPGAAARMPVGAQIPQPEPAPRVTIAVRTKVPGGVNLTGAPVRRCHGVGRYWRWWFGIRRVSCTQGTRRLVGQALEGLG